jgi:very-short-patch-repair endonuclease
MSRARNKMVLFHSIPKDKITNRNDLRKQVIDWFYNSESEERQSGLDKVREEVTRGRASEFEYAVAEIICNKGFTVIPQYEVAGYRIDLVVQGENAKLAIECDGDQYHNGLEKWQEDIERQQIIERSGWQFWRVSGSSFYRHKEKALESLWEKLEDMNIHPTT